MLRSDFPVLFHDADGVCCIQPVFQPVVHRQNPGSEGFMHGQKFCRDFFCRRIVDIRKGFIQKQPLGPQRHKAGQHRLLFFTSGERRQRPVPQMTDSGKIQSFFQRSSDFIRLHADIFQAKGDFPFYRIHTKLQIRILKHHPHHTAALVRFQSRRVLRTGPDTSSQNVPPILRIDSGRQIQQRALPAAGWPGQYRNIGRISRKADVFQRFDFPALQITEGQIL